MYNWSFAESVTALIELRMGHDAWEKVFRLVKQGDIRPDVALHALDRYLEKTLETYGKNPNGLYTKLRKAKSRDEKYRLEIDINDAVEARREIERGGTVTYKGYRIYGVNKQQAIHHI